MSESYEDLRVWQAAMDLAEDAYHLIERFPRHERFGLALQAQRAAVSVPSNIAEGKGRSDADFARYLLQARGSLWELETQLLLAGRLDYVQPKAVKEFRAKSANVGKMLSGLISVLRPGRAQAAGR